MIASSVQCCWTCKECRQNDIIGDQGKVCNACPRKSWPDARRRRCELIEPYYIRPGSALFPPVLCLALGRLGLKLINLVHPHFIFHCLASFLGAYL